MKRKEISLEFEFIVKRKRYVGNFDVMIWDKNVLKFEVEGYVDEIKVNWFELFRRY